MRFTRILIIMVVAMALAACGTSKSNNSNSNINSANDPVPTVPALLASGGTSTSGTGGSGGYVYVESYGAVKVLKSGTVDASFDSAVSAPTPSFGTNHYIVSGGTTTVLLDIDESGVLCTFNGDGNLYIGDGSGSCDGNDTMVTGLTIDAGATLVLVDQGYCGGPSCGGYAVLQLSNDLVINGTLMIDVNITSGIYIESNIIDVEEGGKITTSATTDDSNAGAVYLGYGNNITKTIINRGTIEAKGLGTGSGGYLYFDADDLIVNYGTIDASGGSSATGSGGNGNEIDIYLNNANNAKFYSFGAILAKGGDSNDSNGSNGGTGGYLYIDVPDLVVNTGIIDVSGGVSDTGAGGSGGEFDVYVGYGDFYSSGIVRMNGGKGATNGGDTESSGNSGYWYGYSAWIETAYYDNTRGRNGDIIIGGTWEANGGGGANGNGGAGGYIYLQTDAMGVVTINAAMSAKGGNSTEAGFPGGNAEYGIEIYSLFDPWGSGMYNDLIPGKIRIAGQFDLRGGNGDEMGGNGGYFYVYSGGYNSSNIGSDVELVGFPAMNLNGGDGANGGSAASYSVQLNTNSPNGMPAGPITNEADIEARGGNAVATTGSTGGSGGNVEMITSGISDPLEIITNSGNIDISGGIGDTGGSSSMINLGAQHVTNSGNLTANGGNVTTGGATGGGGGGNIYLNSYDVTTLTTNTGTLSVTGGTPDGSDGSVNIDTGGPT
jgi:hypothetical protein